MIWGYEDKNLPNEMKLFLSTTDDDLKNDPFDRKHHFGRPKKRERREKFPASFLGCLIDLLYEFPPYKVYNKLQGQVSKDTLYRLKNILAGKNEKNIEKSPGINNYQNIQQKVQEDNNLPTLTKMQNKVISSIKINDLKRNSSVKIHDFKHKKRIIRKGETKFKNPHILKPDHSKKINLKKDNFDKPNYMKTYSSERLKKAEEKQNKPIKWFFPEMSNENIISAALQNGKIELSKFCSIIVPAHEKSPKNCENAIVIQDKNNEKTMKSKSEIESKNEGFNAIFDKYSFDIKKPEVLDKEKAKYYCDPIGDLSLLNPKHINENFTINE